MLLVRLTSVPHLMEEEEEEEEYSEQISTNRGFQVRYVVLVCMYQKHLRMWNDFT